MYFKAGPKKKKSYLDGVLYIDKRIFSLFVITFHALYSRTLPENLFESRWKRTIRVTLSSVALLIWGSGQLRSQLLFPSRIIPRGECFSRLRRPLKRKSHSSSRILSIRSSLYIRSRVSLHPLDRRPMYYFRCCR